MLNDLRTDNPQHSLDDGELPSHVRSSSLPETRDIERTQRDVSQEEGQKHGGGEGEEQGEEQGEGKLGQGGGKEGRGEGEKREGEGRGEGGGERKVEEREGGDKRVEKRDDVPVETTRETRTNSEGEMSLKRRIGVVDRPQVVVIGGNDPIPSPIPPELSRPRSATTPHTQSAVSRDRLGSEDSHVKQGRIKSAGPGQRKRPAKKLEVKPVQKEPSAAAQKLVQSKKERATTEMDGAEGRVEAEGEDAKVQSDSTNDETKKNSSVEVCI